MRTYIPTSFRQKLTLFIAKTFKNIHFLSHFDQFLQWLVSVMFRMNIDYLINRQNCNETCPSTKHRKRYEISPLIKYIMKNICFSDLIFTTFKTFFYYSFIYYFVRFCFLKTLKGHCPNMVVQLLQN